MGTLTDLDNNRVVMAIRENVTLFDLFDEVYLFGSVLDGTKKPNDVDLLLIYSDYSDVMIDEIKKISHLLERLIGLAVDLTILSTEEVCDTQFLGRISQQCMKLK